MAKNLIPKKIRNNFRKARDWFRIHLISDERYIKYLFKKRLGKTLDIKNPKTLNEKMQWIKLYERDPIRTICTDKYRVRKYIKEKIGEEFLIPLIFHTEDPQDIKPENLPDYPFIIKTNHDSSGGIIVWEKSEIDWENTRSKLAKLLSKNYYTQGREWQYKDIKPIIIVEKLLLNKNGEIPNEMKISCFNGEPQYLSVIKDKQVAGKKIVNFLNLEWEFVDRKPDKQNDILIYPEPPVILEKMLNISKELSKDFSVLRVDLYACDDKIYFGEMTFTSGNGIDADTTDEYDLKLGQILKLPFEKNTVI